MRRLLQTSKPKRIEDTLSQGKRRPLEVGDKRLFSVNAVREKLDSLSREPFRDFLALLLGAHPTEQNILDFANKNPDKWATAVSMFSKLTGYREEIDVNMNIYAQVHHMSDMDLEHQLRDLQRQMGDSYLVDPATIETPYKRIDSKPRAVRRIIRNS